jgi:putative oxidoreductase
MEQVLGRYTPYLYALLRIVAGLTFIMHGTQKLFGWPSGKPVVQIGSLPWIAGFIEVVCGFLLIIGLFTSIAAFIASGEMAVVYFWEHASRGLWPIQNQGELAVLYCFLFLYIASHGSGVWSLDGIRRPKRRPGPILYKRAS